MTRRDCLTQRQFVDFVDRPGHIAHLRHRENGSAYRHRSARQRQQEGCYAGHQRGADQGPSKSKAPHQTLRGQRAEYSAAAAHRDHRAQHYGVDPEFAHGEENIQAASETQEDGGRGRPQQHRAQNRFVP